ncbi:MAG: exopolyphosphatase [Firmicutes bacterium]|nr:exopolyphosphatase [Bacillota bacterium]
MNKKCAIIDLGSNSLRMIIMKVYEDGSYKMIDQAKEMVRLSEGMGDKKTLKRYPIERTLNTLKIFKKLLDINEVEDVFCVATAAVRLAKNKEYFLKRVKDETNFEFNVLSGDKEAYYDFLGVVNTIDEDNYVMIDIGGGSTEIAHIENKRIKNSYSFSFGAVNLTEKFYDEALKDIDIEKAQRYIKQEFNKIKWIKQLKDLPVIGLGGTIRTVAKVEKKRIDFPLENLHNYRLTKENMVEVFNIIKDTKVKKRKKISGVSKKRGDIILAGLTPLKTLLDYINGEKIIISGNGLREGVFFEKFLLKDSVIIKDVLYYSLKNIIKIYDVNKKHGNHVKKLALEIFDQTIEIHKFNKQHRKLLEVASILHDIGLFIDYYYHQKHGFYLLLNSRLYGLTNKEKILCAYLVAMHREKAFKHSWKNYKMIISKKEYKLIKKLSLFLKIAEKLDRSGYGNIEEIYCSYDNETVNIILKAQKGTELEIAAASRVSKKFYKRYKKKLIFKSY